MFGHIKSRLSPRALIHTLTVWIPRKHILTFLLSPNPSRALYVWYALIHEGPAHLSGISVNNPAPRPSLFSLPGFLSF